MRTQSSLSSAHCAQIIPPFIWVFFIDYNFFSHSCDGIPLRVSCSVDWIRWQINLWNLQPLDLFLFPFWSIFLCGLISIWEWTLQTVVPHQIARGGRIQPSFVVLRCDGNIDGWPFIAFLLPLCFSHHICPNIVPEIKAVVDFVLWRVVEMAVSVSGRWGGVGTTLGRGHISRKLALIFISKCRFPGRMHRGLEKQTWRENLS